MAGLPYIGLKKEGTPMYGSPSSRLARAAASLYVMRHYKSTMLKLSIIYWLTLLMSVTFAQTKNPFKISGTAISFYTNKPIPDGFVHFQKDGKTKSTVCDSLGHFVMSGLSKGKYTLSFEIMKGYYYKDQDTSFLLTNNIDNFRFIAHLACGNNFDKQNALDDIKSNVPKILLVSKQVFDDTLPHITLNVVDKAFQNKYGIIYSDQSVHVGYEECMLPYNLAIFKYLDKKFGIEWRKELRQDAVGSKDK